MAHSSVSVTIVVVLVNLWQMVHLRKHNSRLCGPTVTADGVLFDGNDQIVLPNQQYNPENVDLVQFSFKTTSAEGLLLSYTGTESSAVLRSLEIVDGKLLFRLNFGPDSTVMISRLRYNDGNWHDLETKRTSEHLYMMLDGIVVSTALVPENFNETYDDSNVIYIGDFKEIQHPSVTAKGYKGFLRNIRLGNVAVDLNSLIKKSSCHKRIRRGGGHNDNSCNGATDFRAPYVGATNVELSWISTNCNIEYEVETKQLGTNESLHNYSINTTKDHHIEIKDLTRNVTYEFTLCKKSKINVTTGHSYSLMVDKVTESSIAISWEVPENSPSDLVLTISNKTSWIEIAKISANGTSDRYEFSKLEPGSEYQVKLSDDVGVTRSNRTIKTKGVFLDNFDCSFGESEGTIDCSWGRGNGYDCSVNYQLNVTDSPELHYRNFSNHMGSSFTTYEKLELPRPGQSYSISIQYFANSYSSKVMNKIAVAKTGISESLLKEFINSSSHSFIIDYFNDSDREVEHYRIEVMNDSRELSPNNSSVLIDGLEAGHNYTVSAIAWSNGVESKKLSINVSTVPNPPSVVECTGSSDKSLTVAIEPPEEGSFDYCEISYYDGARDERVNETRTVDNFIIRTLKDLKPYTNYTIRVKYGMTFTKWRSQEKSKICTTKEGTPGEVRDLNVSAVLEDRFTITWDSPDSPNGVITGYVVKLCNHQGVLIKAYTTTEKTKEIKHDIFTDEPQQRIYSIKVAAKTSAGEGKETPKTITLPKITPTNHLLIAALVILTILLVVLIGLLGYYFIRKSPSRMQSVRRISSRLMHTNNEMRYFKQPAVSSKPVKISDFVTYLEKLEKDSGLKLTEEYEDLKFVGRNQSKDDAELQCNRVKNRFTNILPYDISRVKLLAMEDEEGSDYINASWIPGFHSKREFIASQGPLPSTVNDFWRMIWENNCQAIVMLTLCIEKGHIKCEQYWPVQNEPVCYGDVKVEMQHEETNEEWHTREFKISLGSQSRKLIHFHYVTWPDMYVPQRMSLIEFVREIRAALNKNNGKGPIVVHCSAGVGRSGTFIALDTLLHQILADRDLDVYGVVFQMRMNRVLMVQTEAQYTFIYECLKQILDERNGLTVTEDNAESQNCREGVRKEEAEDDPTSDSKEKQSQTGCTATESNQNSETKEKVQAKEPERNNDKTQDTSSSIKEESSPKENSAKSESKSNLNSDENSSKTDNETKNLEISNQNLGDGKDNGR